MIVRYKNRRIEGQIEGYNDITVITRQGSPVDDRLSPVNFTT